MRLGGWVSGWVDEWMFFFSFLDRFVFFVPCVVVVVVALLPRVVVCHIFPSSAALVLQRFVRAVSAIFVP